MNPFDYRGKVFLIADWAIRLRKVKEFSNRDFMLLAKETYYFLKERANGVVDYTRTAEVVLAPEEYRDCDKYEVGKEIMRDLIRYGRYPYNPTRQSEELIQTMRENNIFVESSLDKILAYENEDHLISLISNELEMLIN